MKYKPIGKQKKETVELVGTETFKCMLNKSKWKARLLVHL